MRHLSYLVTLLVAVATASACSLDLGGTLAGELSDAGGLPDATPTRTFDAGAPEVDASGMHDASSAVDAMPIDSSVGVVDSSTDGGVVGVDCAGVLCDGACLNAATCATCAAGHALCPATNTCGDCSTCTGGGGTSLSVACYSCDAMGGNPVGTCEADDVGGFCLDSIYPDGGTHCPCLDFDVTTCPGSNQVCVQVDTQKPVCVTCGETYYATDMAVCQANASCQATATPPHCE
jgi:hypothetical protein